MGAEYFFNLGTLVRITLRNGSTYTGYIYSIDLAVDESRSLKPYCKISITQDYRFVKQEGKFDSITISINKIQTIKVVRTEREGEVYVC